MEFYHRVSRGQSYLSSLEEEYVRRAEYIMNTLMDALSAESDLHWYAYYTRARHEQRVAERLRQIAFETFVPRIPVQRQWRDRKKVVDWPLFPGYVFVLCAPHDIRKIVSTTSVVSVVCNNGKPAPVSSVELDNVRLLIESLTAIGGTPERVPLQPGLAVCVSDGPLKGVEGVVIEQRNSRKFIVQLTTIGEGLVVNVDDRMLAVKRDKCGGLVRYEQKTYVVSASMA